MSESSPLEASGALEPPEVSVDDVALASPHDHFVRADWESAAAAVLRKTRRLSADDPDDAVWQSLATTTLDGLTVPPLGVADQHPDEGLPGASSAEQRAVRPTRPGDWDLRAPTLGADNAAVLDDLEHGATSLWVRVTDETDLAALLDGVLLDLAPVVLDAAKPLTAATALLGIADQRGVDLHPQTNLGADAVTTPTDELLAVARLASDHGVRGVVVDGTAWHDEGASDAQELGYTLAVGAACLRELTTAGFGLDEALGLIEFRYAATVEQFATVAKLRAARQCWARVAELSGAAGADQIQVQHAVTSRPMLSAYDVYTNILRTTVAAFAAGVGGAESVTVLPFDQPLGEPDRFGRRIARNVSALLLAESHLGAVADPAGGAHAVERFTDDLALAGWEEFGRIESSGGIRAALDDASALERVAATVDRRDQEVATRRRPITGLSEFPDLGETRPERPGPADATRRYGAAFEAFRNEPVSDPVFLATMGSVADHTARAGFALNLLAAGGIPVDQAGPTSDADEVVAAYAGQRVVCLAGTDGAYAAWGADLIAALRQSGARHVVLAGRPGERTVSADLLDDACALGVDAVEFLRRTRAALTEGDDL